MYGFAVRPQHLKRYREHASIYKVCVCVCVCVCARALFFFFWLSFWWKSSICLEETAGGSCKWGPWNPGMCLSKRLLVLLL
jgi:hypothetical protein